MSIEADLSAFRDLALEEQAKIPFYEEQYGGVSCIFQSLDPILAEIIGDNEVVVTGDVYLPDIDDEGRVIGVRHSTDEETPVTGASCGIIITQRDSFDAATEDSPVIGYWVNLQKAITVTTPVQIAMTQLFAFAPVESSGLLVPERLIASPEPEPDDAIAQAIDECILNDPKSFYVLDQLFKNLALKSDLEVEFYLNYLNRVFNVSNFSLRVVTTDLYEDLEQCLLDVVHQDDEAIVTFVAQQFAFVEQLGGLCLSGENDAGVTQLIPIESMKSARFTECDAADTSSEHPRVSIQMVNYN